MHSIPHSGVDKDEEGEEACSLNLHRVRHGYGKTRRFSKTGSAGTGTVVDFGTPWHTAYPYHGITGMHG